MILDCSSFRNEQLTGVTA